MDSRIYQLIECIVDESKNNDAICGHCPVPDCKLWQGLDIDPERFEHVCREELINYMEGAK